MNSSTGLFIHFVYQIDWVEFAQGKKDIME